MEFAGVTLFNFEREFSAESNLVVSQAAKQSCEQQQRDVYESHRHRTFSLAFYMTGNEIEAEEILTTTFVHAFQQSEQPDAFAIDSALLNQLGQRYPLRKEVPAAVPSPGNGLSPRNVRRPDLEVAIRDLPPNDRAVARSATSMWAKNGPFGARFPASPTRVGVVGSTDALGE